MVRALNAAGAVACQLYADDFRFRSVEPGIERISGIDAGTWCSPDFWRVHLHPHDRPALEQAIAAAASGRFDTLAFRIAGPGETVAPLLLCVRPAADTARAARSPLDGYLVLSPTLPKTAITDAPLPAAPFPSATADAVPAGDGVSAGDARELRELHEARRQLLLASQLATAGELLGGITHDLRQPLTALQMDIGIAKHLLRGDPPSVEKALAALDDAASDVNRVRESLEVIQDLVARREPSRKPVHLDAVVEEVVRLVLSEASARRVRLDVTRAPNLSPISGDHAMVREALLSIVLDAVGNASRDGDAIVRIVTKVADERRVEVALAYRRRAGVAGDHAWALSVARSIAEAHGGTFSVDDSSEAVVVRITWPIGAEGADASAASAVSALDAAPGVYS